MWKTLVEVERTGYGFSVDFLIGLCAQSWWSRNAGLLKWNAIWLAADIIMYPKVLEVDARLRHRRCNTHHRDLQLNFFAKTMQL